MFVYEIVGISEIDKKGLLILHLKYTTKNCEGYAVESIFVKEDFIEGTAKCGELCRVYRNSKGYVIGVEIV